MREFHISDVLSVTTGRLVSNRHIDGVYDILNYLTGENLFTHMLPAANRLAEPWLAKHFPQLMESHPQMQSFLQTFEGLLKVTPKEELSGAVEAFVNAVRKGFDLPEMLQLEPMPNEMLPKERSPLNLRESLKKLAETVPVIVVEAPKAN